MLMKENIKKLILMQGYEKEILCDCKNVNLLVRWTPLCCALFGTLGLYLESSVYFIILGLLTTLGALSHRSFYDNIYNATLRFVLKTQKTPQHGNQRKFGCGIGAFLYLIGGIGFYFDNVWLSYCPTLFIVFLAYIAAFSQWCFASTIYNLLFSKK